MRKTWVEGERKGRGLRILPKDVGYFVHVTSRTRAQEFLLGDVEKQSFLLRMRQWSDFSGITVLTHCMMSNHFHMLLWVPMVSELSHAEIVARLKAVWPDEKLTAWEEVYTSQSVEKRKAMDQGMLERMGDLPAFMRVLKQSFSNWYNHRNGCKGTFWEGRYRSVVVEDNPLALMSVAAYIDLNPLRAGLVSDPLDTVWSGYGSACGGNLSSQSGLAFLIERSRGLLPSAARSTVGKRSEKVSTPPGVPHPPDTGQMESINWQNVQKSYRIWLYAKGDDGSENPYSREKVRSRQGIPPKEVLAEFERKGEVPQALLLRQKWRCFTRGVAIGSPPFLEGVLNQNRSCFGPHRKSMGFKLKNQLPGLQALRQVD